MLSIVPHTMSVRFASGVLGIYALRRCHLRVSQCCRIPWTFWQTLTRLRVLRVPMLILFDLIPPALS